MDLVLDWDLYAAKARELVAEGCVLLKNDKETLPLKKGMKVSLFGRSMFRYIKSGTGSGGQVKAPYIISIPEALKEDVTINPELEKVYLEWMKKNPFILNNGWNEPWFQPEMEVSEEVCTEASRKSDIALVIIGRTAGEDKDNTETKGSYYLTDSEELLLKRVRKAFDRMVVLLNVGNIIDMNWVETVNPDSVMYVWQGGQEGGHGIADVLMGRVNPSGKLPDTVCKDLKRHPAGKNFGSETENCYEEDIYVGYRYFETIDKENVRYPFGFGLSYSSFAISGTGEFGENVLTVNANVENKGAYSGKEAVQVYVEAPNNKLCKPARVLSGFKKTGVIEPSGKETVEITIPVSRFASFDDSGVTGHRNAWVLEAGEYGIFLGGDARNAKNIGSFAIPETVVVEQCKECCPPVKPFRRLVIRDGIAAHEEVPLRTYDLKKRIEERMPVETGYHGFKGITFKDYLSGKATEEDLISEMEDIDLICLTRGEGMCSPKVTKGIVGSFGGVTPKLHDELGIPVAGTSDGPSGIRMISDVPAFSLPNGTLQAASFNTELIREVYEFEGIELRKNKIDTLLGPGLNIHRYPLNGRNFEYFSEDPLLTGLCAVAQLEGIHKYGVTGTIKHFACNSQETKRHFVDAIVSQRALREIYFKAFEIAVREGGAYCLMTSYNPVNGVHAAGNYDLNNTLIRDEWAFDGLAMTDWWARVDEENEAPDKKYSYNMVKARGDVYMVTPDSAANGNGDLMEEALADGRLKRSELELVAKDILKTLSRMLVSKRMQEGEDSISEKNIPEIRNGIVNMLPEIDLAGDSTVDISNIRCEADINNRFNIRNLSREGAVMYVTLRCEGDEFTQNSVLCSLSGKTLSAIGINGGREWVTKQVDVIVALNTGTEMNLYFPQEGVEIKEIRIVNK